MEGTTLRVAFIGLGNMGGPMAANLVKAGHDVVGVDLSEDAKAAFVAVGGRTASSAAEAVRNAQAVVSMLPAGKHVRAVYMSEDGILANVPKGAIIIDSSTIDVDSSRAVAEAATQAGMDMVDAPVSGGIVGAANGTLTFMVGGSDRAFERAKPLLDVMGGSIVHAGDAGAGQAAKICNNMLLGISMIGTCEAFALAEKLGLDPQKLYDISSKSSGQCWSMTSYCPIPGPVPTSPANNDYKPGFAAAMMLKDLLLAKEASESSGASTPMGEKAAALYEAYCDNGGENADFSGIIHLLRNTK